MKKIKRLLLILPLVALFIIGSLPVSATPKEDKARYNRTLAELEAKIQNIEAFKLRPDIKISDDDKNDRDGNPLEDGQLYFPGTAIAKVDASIQKAGKVIIAADKKFEAGRVDEAIADLNAQQGVLDQAFDDLEKSIKQFKSENEDERKLRDEYALLVYQLNQSIDELKNLQNTPQGVKISNDGEKDRDGTPLEENDVYYPGTAIDQANKAIQTAEETIIAAQTKAKDNIKGAIEDIKNQIEKIKEAHTALEASRTSVKQKKASESYEKTKKELEELIRKINKAIENVKESDDGAKDKNGEPLKDSDRYASSSFLKSAKAAVLTAEEAFKQAEAATNADDKLNTLMNAMKNSKVKEVAQELSKEIKVFSSVKESCSYALVVKYYENMKREGEVKEAQRTYRLDGEFVAKHIQGEEGLLNQVAALAKAIQNFVESQLQNGYKPYPNTYRDTAYKLLNPTDEEKKTGKITATVEMGKEVAETVKVIAYDIHHNCFVFDRLYELELRDGWRSPKDASKAFYDNSDALKNHYLYAGYATREIAPVIIYRRAYLEQIAKNIYIKALNTYKADVVAFVVPRTIDVKTIHTFPEGTRDELIEYVPVPYEVWASLQHSSQFMNLPKIFKTRIQKVNDQGFAFREIAYYNGLNPITGLVSGYDWYGFPVAGDGDYDFYARVFYDKAVAAAKEVPSEKKVDAASAPQAQLQVPSAQSKIQAQAQAPMTAANATTTSAPANTLPVTGASDSIFPFLSSAALMAVGILFSKKD